MVWSYRATTLRLQRIRAEAAAVWATAVSGSRSCLFFAHAFLYCALTVDLQVAALHGLLKPHLLRRVKKDVLKQLPPKREQIVRVDLSPLQRTCYRALLTRNFGALRAVSGPGSAAGGKAAPVALRNLLMQLRKVCQHPFLLPDVEAGNVPTNPPAAAGVGPEKAESPQLAALLAASCKLQLVDAMVGRLRARGHRILIYSQFTSVLDVLEDWLALRNWGCQRIDGNVASAERQRRIDAFNAPGSQCSVFLLSTRAGGLGINLATADTVIMFDRCAVVWWTFTAAWLCVR